MGFETLTLAPIDRRLVARDLLTDEERAQLDAYHARVLTVVGPIVPPEVARWLEGACAPI
jgi:Xaa-Pro aminopeptidase